MEPDSELNICNDHALGRGVEIEKELRLDLQGDFRADARQLIKKRLFWEIVDGPAKNRVVGGLHCVVCMYRKRAIASNQKEGCAAEDDSSKTFVKVRMDGVVYLQKIELDAQGGYGELALAIEKLFGCTGIGLSEASKENTNTSEYKLIYEDKDGDWMLVGDVPWKMFLGSCNRLRVTKRYDVQNKYSVSATSSFRWNHVKRTTHFRIEYCCRITLLVRAS